MVAIFPPIARSLVTERLNLRLWEETDTSWHRHLAGERGDGAPSAEDDLAAVRRVSAVWAESGIALFALDPLDGGETIGYCGLIIGRSTLEEPELAYELFRSTHGNGYATEAARAVVTAARATGRARLWSTVRAWNAPSFRVLEKLGFHRERSTWDDRGELVWNRLDL